MGVVEGKDSSLCEPGDSNSNLGVDGRDGVEHVTGSGPTTKGAGVGGIEIGEDQR